MTDRTLLINAKEINIATKILPVCNSNKFSVNHSDIKMYILNDQVAVNMDTFFLNNVEKQMDPSMRGISYLQNLKTSDSASRLS